MTTGISLVVGGIIGSGIFMKPSVMAAQLGSPELLVAVWILAGLITLLGALTNAEVATLLPETGGQFIFFRHMYGDFVAFLYGWSAFAVFNTAGVASIAYVVGTYTEYFVSLPRFPYSLEKSMAIDIPLVGTIYPLENIGVKGVTIIVVLILTWVNYISARSGGSIQVLFTGLKVLAMVLIVFTFFFSPAGQVSNLTQDSTLVQPEGWAMMAALMAAISGAFWAYDGWNNITFVAGELNKPQTDIPKSLFAGLLTCIAIYTVITLSYLYIIPIDEMAQSAMVASDAAVRVLGTAGGGMIALMVILSTFGTTNGNVLATARVTFAMAQNGHFFRSMGRVHPKFGTPGNALLLHGVWTSLLVLSGSFDMLTDMLIFVSWMFYGLSAAGVFVLRRKMPHTHRPYKVIGYPVVPAIFVLFTLFFLVVTLVSDIRRFLSGEAPVINSLLGLLLMFAGIPLYWYFRKDRKDRESDMALAEAREK